MAAESAAQKAGAKTAGTAGGLAWGIIGPGSIAGNFAQGLAECDSGHLAAIASRSDERRRDFGDRFEVDPAKRYDDYAALVADPDVGAVYIATPHPFHAQLALMAIRAGKPVLVEKPAGMNAAEAQLLTEAAAQEGVFFMEAFMYRCHPQIARMLEIIASGEIGTPVHIRTSFGFNAPFKASSRAYALELGGGGILDVGCYPVSLARLVAGAAQGKPFAEPVEIKATGTLAATGVDDTAYGLLKFEDGFVAEIGCAVARAMPNDAVITGTRGTLRLPDPWVPGRNAGPSDAVIEVTVDGKTREDWLRDPRMLFAYEAEVASRAILGGKTEAPHPAFSPAETIGNNRVLDAWRAELGYPTAADRPESNRRLTGSLPAGLPAMKTGTIPGLGHEVSRLVMGCDNQNGIAGGAIVWDAFAEAGGTCFDTAHIYGGGKHEAALGEWLKARGAAKDMTVIVKGAHSPYCVPDAIGPQLEISLGRLGLDAAAVYVMHRDNPSVPVSEFVDALNALADKGLITGPFGGSNWSPDRIREANAYADSKGLRGFSILNNNLSLAVMEKPVWAGCVTSNSPETLAALKELGVAHLSWSSQARGYFLPAELRDRLPEDTRPETCFGSDANAERRRRAEEVAARQGVTANAVALAWVLSQAFPSFALIGPRSTGELASTMAALKVELTPEDVAWLNLEG